MKKLKKYNISLVTLIFFGVVTVFNSYSLGHKFGEKSAKNKIISRLNKSELNITFNNYERGTLVVIRQVIPHSDYKKRVIVKREVQGLEFHSYGASIRGNGFGYDELNSIWHVTNNTDKTIDITEAAFVNLPEGFRIKDQIRGNYKISPQR